MTMKPVSYKERKRHEPSNFTVQEDGVAIMLVLRRNAPLTAMEIAYVVPLPVRRVEMALRLMRLRGDVYIVGESVYPT